MRLCEPQDTGQSLALSGFPLAVACTLCGHRRLLTARQVHAHKYDRQQLLRLPLLCRCGSRHIELYLFETPDEVPDFLAVDTPLPGASRRTAGGCLPSF